MSMSRAVLGLLLVAAASLAEDEPQPTLEQLRKEFEAYKAKVGAQLDRLRQTVADQVERVTVAVARAEEAETWLRHMRARLELSRDRHHELLERVATLTEQVKQANATNEKNRTWLHKMSREQAGAMEAARKRFATEFLVRCHLPNAIENYRRCFKRLPPMSIKELNVANRFKSLRIDANASNECGEALLVALRHPDFPAPLRDRYLPTQNPLGNTDADRWNTVPDGSSSLDAKELVDGWGHPIVYIHKNRYDQAVRVVNAKGVEVQVVALVAPDGVYYNPTSYQILSLGPNGVQEVETESLEESDDIRNFELKSK
jgi:hypothetical protein